MTALDDHARWAAVLDQARQTICCPPGQEDVVRDALGLTGQTPFFNVRVSDAVPPGAVFIVKERP